MAFFTRTQREDSDSADSIETVKTGSAKSDKRSTANEEVILQSVDESDVSSVESLPEDFNKSINVARLSNAFEGGQTPRSPARTPRTQRTISFSEDFEASSVDPRGAVTEVPTTARSLPSTIYTLEFEEGTESSASRKSSELRDESSGSIDARKQSHTTDSFETESYSADR